MAAEMAAASCVTWVSIVASSPNEMRPICAAHEESVKAEATALLRQLVALKRTEVELMQQGVVQNAGHAVCDDALLQRIAHQLGVSQL